MCQRVLQLPKGGTGEVGEHRLARWLVDGAVMLPCRLEDGIADRRGVGLQQGHSQQEAVASPLLRIVEREGIDAPDNHQSRVGILVEKTVGLVKTGHILPVAARNSRDKKEHYR